MSGKGLMLMVVKVSLKLDGAGEYSPLIVLVVSMCFSAPAILHWANAENSP